MLELDRRRRGRRAQTKRDWSFGSRSATRVPRSALRTADRGGRGVRNPRTTSGWPAFESELQRAKVHYQAFIYPGVEHGFNNDTTQRYDAAAAKLAAAQDRVFQQTPARLKASARCAAFLSSLGSRLATPAACPAHVHRSSQTRFQVAVSRPRRAQAAFIPGGSSVGPTSWAVNMAASPKKAARPCGLVGLAVAGIAGSRSFSDFRLPCRMTPDVKSKCAPSGGLAAAYFIFDLPDVNLLVAETTDFAAPITAPHICGNAVWKQCLIDQLGGCSTKLFKFAARDLHRSRPPVSDRRCPDMESCRKGEYVWRGQNNPFRFKSCGRFVSCRGEAMRCSCNCSTVVGRNYDSLAVLMRRVISTHS
jgi:Dienelactone hydrolase family